MRRAATRTAAALVLTVGLVITAPISPADGRPARAQHGVGTCTRDSAGDLRWVAGLYRGLLGRDPAMSEAATWLPALQRGQTYQQVARAIAGSDEALRRATAEIFGELLGRAPTAPESDAWLPVVRAEGAGRLAIDLAAGEEAHARAGGTVEGWLAWAYDTILARPLDPGGRSYWVPLLSGGANRTRATAQLWNAPERMGRRVDALYRALLGRPADPSGRAHWGQVALARGDVAVAAELAATQGAWNRAQVAFGGEPSTMPAPCPAVLRWVPAPGSLVHDLKPVAHMGSRLVSLTFDDGPHPTWTPQILDVLRRHGVSATFFVVGNFADRHPDLLRRIVADGHRVANHSRSHPDMRNLSESAQNHQIASTTASIERVLGPGHVRCFRPPYGGYDNATLRAASGQGLATIMWSRDGQDWASPGVERIVSGNLDTRWDGGRGITVLHDGGNHRAQTVAALPQMIEALRARGYRFVQIC